MPYKLNVCRNAIILTILLKYNVKNNFVTLAYFKTNYKKTNNYARDVKKTLH